MLTQQENPNGLYRRYTVHKADGRNTDPRAEYFVLRLDPFGGDPEHIAACRIAALAWCDAAPPHLKQVADELRAMVASFGQPDWANGEDVEVLLRRLAQAWPTASAEERILIEQRMMAATNDLEEHPEWFEFPCLCDSCRSYA